VELALIIPMLVMMSFAVYEFGRALQAQNTVVQAAREGARVGMNIAVTDATIEAATRAAAAPYTLSSVAITHPSSTELRVTANYAFTSDIWFIGNFTVGSSMDTVRQ
jgi:Flp pilus assembly protein TadG